MSAELLQKTIHTEQTGIFITRVRIGSRSVWRHVDCNEGRNGAVGEQYPTRRELLSDHYSYLRRAGWMPAPQEPEYVVYSANESSLNDGAGFWSSRFGWVDFESAGLFTHTEVTEGRLSLPLSTGNDAKFVIASDAEKHYG